jgi:transposase-like protein
MGTALKRFDADPLAGFACPNEDCSDFNIFGAGNLSVCERMGKDKRLRRLYCKSCQQRFSERKGTLLEYSKLSEETTVRIVKCLSHGCSVAATADICEVDPRTVELFQEKSGKRAADFHQLQLEKLDPPEVVEIDEMHGSVIGSKKGGRKRKLARLQSVRLRRKRTQLLASVVARDAIGSTAPWP